MVDLDMRKIAEALWCLLDDIDSASDMFKPSDNNPDSYKRFYSYAMKKQGLRFKYLTSDGYKLFTKSQWKNFIRKQKLIQISSNEPLSYPKNDISD